MTATNQAQPSEISMRKPSGMVPSPSVLGREPSAREPSMAALDQAQLSEIFMREPSAIAPHPSVSGDGIVFCLPSVMA